jgi:hypothetical protein
MSYVRKPSAGPKRAALGSVLDDINAYLGKAGAALDSVKVILDDPALPQVTGIVMDLHRLEQPGGKGDSIKGIGLKRLVTPLKAYRYTRQHSWALPVAMAAVVALPFAIGYALGKGKRS